MLDFYFAGEFKLIFILLSRGRWLFCNSHTISVQPSNLPLFSFYVSLIFVVRREKLTLQSNFKYAKDTKKIMDLQISVIQLVGF